MFLLYMSILKTIAGTVPCSDAPEKVHYKNEGKAKTSFGQCLYAAIALQSQLASKAIFEAG